MGLVSLQHMMARSKKEVGRIFCFRIPFGVNRPVCILRVSECQESRVSSSSSMDSSFPAAASSSVEELVRREVADWDDEVVCNARFKAFSGQRSDWEPSFLFWRDLIIKIARHLGVCIIDASEVFSFHIPRHFVLFSVSLCFFFFLCLASAISENIF